jgi:hypothetical protein
MTASADQALPQLWVGRAHPRGSEARGADAQALHISEAMAQARPVVYVSRADDQRQEALRPERLQRVLVRDAHGGVSVVPFDVEIRSADAQGHAMANPYVEVNLHIDVMNASGHDEFREVIESFLQSPEFGVSVADALGSPLPLQEFSSLVTVQNQRVLDSPTWLLPLGKGGTALDRSDLVFHIPLGGESDQFAWVTTTTNLLEKHVAAYQGRTTHRQSFLCFSNYTSSVAIGLGVPVDRICQFPVALPPGRVARVERQADMDVERIAWIGPADAQEKGLHHLVDTLALVNERLAGEGRHVMLDAYGRLPERRSSPAFDAYYDAHYRPLVDRGDLMFHGFLPDVQRNLALAQRDRITVNASEPSNEGLGMASLEAVISAGVGYATRPGGGAEDAAAYVDHAFVASADSHEALADAIISALDHERSLLRQNGRRARHTVPHGMLSNFPEVAGVIDRFVTGVGRKTVSQPQPGRPEPTVG